MGSLYMGNQACLVLVLFDVEPLLNCYLHNFETGEN